MSWLPEQDQVAGAHGAASNTNSNQHHQFLHNNNNNSSHTNTMPPVSVTNVARAPLQRIHEPAYQFSLQPVLDFDTDTENNTAPQQPPPPPSRSQPDGSTTDPFTSRGNTTTPSGAVASVGTGAISSGGVGGGIASGVGGGGASPGNSLRGRGRTRGGAISKRGGGGARPPGALSHTKLCRDRLNGMFEQLRNTLPAAPVGVEVKHKAQVLDYAITVLKAMVRRTSELEIELAVSSNRATMEWVTKLVRASGASFTPVATEVMRVFTKRRHWGLAELWLAHKATPSTLPISLPLVPSTQTQAQTMEASNTNGTPTSSSVPLSPHGRPPSGVSIPGSGVTGVGNGNGNNGSGGGDGVSVRLDFGAAVVNDTLATVGVAGGGAPSGEPLALFAEMSRAFTFGPGEGVQGRVWASMRPEWLAGLRSRTDFARADLAARFGLKTCLAVPITVTGKIEAVMCFYDTRHRPYDSQCVDLAMRLAWALGNATGGKRAGTLEPNSPQITSNRPKH